MLLSNVWSVGLNLPGRHCLRLRPPKLPSQGQINILHLAQKKHPPCAGLDFEFLMDEHMSDEPCSINIVSQSQPQACSASLQVDASLLRFIVGKGGKVKKKIEKDTTTQLKIPSPRDAKRGSSLVVEGSSQAKVDDAVSQIHRVLEEAAESSSLQYSHFISLPLALHPDLVVQVTKFHDSVVALFPAKVDKDDSNEPTRLYKRKSTNYNEDIETLESEKLAKTHTNDIEETEIFENEQVAHLSQTSINDEVEGFESEQVGDLVHPNTETMCNDLDNQDKEDDPDYEDPETLKEPEEDAEIPRSLQKGHGIEESIFIKPATLHLTVLMLKLWSKERVAAAVEVLQGLSSKLLEALDHRPVAVRLKGVECMRGSPAKAHVLYARVEDADKENRLLGACKVIKDAFIEAGLVSEREKKQELKLHATLMNTSHRKRKKGKRFGRQMPFDARPILSAHGSEEWGEYTITEAHLSERFVFDEDGYYHCCGSVKFPPSAHST